MLGSRVLSMLMMNGMFGMMFRGFVMTCCLLGMMFRGFVMSMMIMMMVSCSVTCDHTNTNS